MVDRIARAQHPADLVGDRGCEAPRAFGRVEGVQLRPNRAPAAPLDGCRVVNFANNDDPATAGKDWNHCRASRLKHTGARTIGGEHRLHRGQPLLGGDHRDTEIGEELGTPDLGPWAPVDPDGGKAKGAPMGDKAVDPRVRGGVRTLPGRAEK